MDLHLSRSDLIDALSAGGTQADLDAALEHLSECRRCQELAVGVVEELREGCALAPLPDVWVSQLKVLDEKVRHGLDELRGSASWAELQDLAPEMQRERIRSVLALQTRRTFEAAISKAALLASSDPHLGEETALTARLIAELLPSHRYPEKLKNDLQGTAMGEVGNFRRLAADWSGSKAAFQEAGSFLERGSGDLRRKGRLLSVSASLATDTGNLEAALRLVHQAADYYRKAKDSEGLASVAVQEAGMLIACGRFEEAMATADQALATRVKNSRLEMLAKSIITSCLIDLNRPAQALLSFQSTRPLYEQIWRRRDQLGVVDYLEARLLDALGCTRDSEKKFRALIKTELDEEFYKDAFIHTLTFFESLYNRGAFDKAARVCEEASGLLNTPFCHPQMKQVWEELVAQVRSNALTVSRILEVRLYVIRHWNVPAARIAFGQVQMASGISFQSASSLASSEAEVPESQEPPARRTLQTAEKSIEAPELANGGFQRSLDEYERKLLAAALQQTGGNITATARLVGKSLTGLKSRIEELGLGPVVARARPPKIKSMGPRRRASYGPSARTEPR